MPGRCIGKRRGARVTLKIRVAVTIKIKDTARHCAETTWDVETNHSN
jgi:hypothetical protein